jgi:hypothetical protein
MRAVWSAPGNNTLQGANGQTLVRINNTLRRELTTLQDQLLRGHQQEDVVDGGLASSIQFHYLISPTFSDNGAVLTTPVFHFDANEGQAGTASWVFDNRRDFDNRREV